jgi:cytoskeletal protein CcmA (bactofilin family)
MAEKNKRDDFSINTMIGPASSVFGSIESGGFTRIDGDLHGDLCGRGSIVIGENARLESRVSGSSVTVGGVVYGNVIASESLTILSTGLILGDVLAKTVKAEEGCVVHGKITVCQDGRDWDKKLAKYEKTAWPERGRPATAKGRDRC